MVAVYKNGEKEVINTGEVLKDNDNYFTIHSSNEKLSKKEYNYKKIP